MTVNEIKKRIKEVRNELNNASGINFVKLENELETLVYLMEVKRI